MFKHKAFTLIELLVVIGIVLLLSFGVISGLSASRQSKEVRVAAENLKNYLNEARSLAITPSDTDFGLEKIQVRIYVDPNKVELRSVNTDDSEEKISEFDIPRGITISGSHASPHGNMQCSDDCSHPEYYYFSYAATDIHYIGQIIDYTDVKYPIKIDVIGVVTYELKAALKTGLIEIVEVEE